MDLQGKNSMSHLTAKDVRQAYLDRHAAALLNADKVVQKIIKEKILPEYAGGIFKLELCKLHYNIPVSVLVSKLKNLGFKVLLREESKSYIELGITC